MKKPSWLCRETRGRAGRRQLCSHACSGAVHRDVGGAPSTFYAPRGETSSISVHPRLRESAVRAPPPPPCARTASHARPARCARAFHSRLSRSDLCVVHKFHSVTICVACPSCASRAGVYRSRMTAGRGNYTGYWAARAVRRTRTQPPMAMRRRRPWQLARIAGSTYSSRHTGSGP